MSDEGARWTGRRRDVRAPAGRRERPARAPADRRRAARAGTSGRSIGGMGRGPVPRRGGHPRNAGRLPVRRPRGARDRAARGRPGGGRSRGSAAAGRPLRPAGLVDRPGPRGCRRPAALRRAR
ncbi:MAG: hypothetical protein FJ038_06440 [Chloroflexi bacterium]|nr:hypothetical protein [Chloroflexota bacterium]